MKLNEIAGGKVWVFKAQEHYEGAQVLGIFSSKEAAQKALDANKKKLDKYSGYDGKSIIDLEIVEVPLNKFSDSDWLLR